MVDESSGPVRREVVALGADWRVWRGLLPAADRPGFRNLECRPGCGPRVAVTVGLAALFTPSQYAGLPGMQFPPQADTYAGRDQVADYLAAYAEHSLADNERSRRLRLNAETAAGPQVMEWQRCCGIAR